MSSFVFNSFKERYLKGEVSAKDTWTFIPVAKNFREQYEFNDVRLDQYRSLSDFKSVKPTVLKYDCDSSALGPYKKGKVRPVSVTDRSFRLKGSGLISGYGISYNWTKKTDSNKPQYINKDNSASFNSFYGEDIYGNYNISNYINQYGGFYYIQSEGELKWFAERSLVNDRIVGVFGNDLNIQISKPIGNDEKIPFNGVIDGNYHTFDFQIKGRSTDCGLVGVLGRDGIVRNFRLKGKGRNFSNTMECDKQITLNHIKNDGRDINCGMLVGRNYGLIENIDAYFEKFTLYGFVPSVYSVTNKSDKYKWNEKTKIVRDKFDYDKENFFYLNSFCINSPGNICPYVGYFNEGKFNDGVEAVGPECCVMPNVEAEGYENERIVWNVGTYFNNWSTEKETELDYDYNIIFDSSYAEGISSTNGIYYPIMGNAIDEGWYNTGNVNRIRNIKYNSKNIFNQFEHTIDGYFSYDTVKSILTHNPLYYGVDCDGYFTTRCYGSAGPYSRDQGVHSAADGSSCTGTWTVNYNSNLLLTAFGKKILSASGLNPSYENTRCSLRLHPQARAAYNIGVIVGSNLGTARNIKVNATVSNSTNFVGFIGGIAGKQSQGNITDVTVNIDYKLIYDLGTKPELGDVAYYKQTPILPEKFKQYVPVECRSTGYETTFYKDFFCAWDYKETNGKAVDTAANVTDDVLQYKLRPIFVAGGLFGRYIPNSPGEYEGITTIVRNATVIYKDNFNSSNTEKRPENAFGVLAGKVDYATTNNGIYYKPSMQCNNCKFSANSTVGESFNTINYHWSDGYGWYPDYFTAAADPNKGYINTGVSNKRFIGIFEIKNNVFDPLSYNVNSYELENNDGTTRQEINIDKMGIYYAGDYPMDMSSHFGGIIKSHSLWPQISAAAGHKIDAGVYGWTTLKDQYTASNDYNQLYYSEPNVDISNNKQNDNYINGVGHNKRNMASKLIELYGCISNLDQYIQVYDDYINEWHLMEIPAGLPSDEVNNNYYAISSLDIISKYWNFKSSKNNAYIYNIDKVSAASQWPAESASIFPNFSSNFDKGLYHEQTNSLLRNGTMNTFDGYTTVYYYKLADYYLTGTYIDAPTGYSRPSNTDKVPILKSNECNCFMTNNNSAWSNAKSYKKNILKHKNGGFYTPTESISIPNVLPTFPKRNAAKYTGKYDYKISITSSPYNLLSSYNTINGVFGYTLPVTFKSFNQYMGYCIQQNQTEINNHINTDLSIGQYVTPSMIYNELNNNTTIYYTTAVSSVNGFGGILVVDSSGRNVMFLDNDKNIDLTGNVITYPTTPNNNDKYILRVQ